MKMSFWTYVSCVESQLSRESSHQLVVQLFDEWKKKSSTEPPNVHEMNLRVINPTEKIPPISWCFSPMIIPQILGLAEAGLVDASLFGVAREFLKDIY